MNDGIQTELNLIMDFVKNNTCPKAVYLFGSYAYGQPHKDSDLDIYVVVPDSETDTVKLGAQIRRDLFNKKSHPIDLLIGKESAFNRRKNSLTLENIIASDGVLLYES